MRLFADISIGWRVLAVVIGRASRSSMPTSGQVLNPRGEYKDMQLEFSGDDDTWLYVDGVPVGDGGGIHSRTEIDINFAKGTVMVTGKKDANHAGTFGETKYLDDIFRTAGKHDDADWEDIGDGSGHKRFKAGTYHTFDMLYLERGGGESNLYIHYNLVSTADFTAHKSYENTDHTAHAIARDQCPFELVGLDGQYQPVYDSAIVETEAPEGYIITDGSWEFTVVGDGSITGPTDVVSGLALSIPNTSGAELPAAGGPGTVATTAAGVVLVAVGAAALLRRRGLAHA